MMRMLRDWSLAVVVGLGVFLAVDWLSKGADLSGKAAPAFELVNVAGGSTTLSDYAGTPVVLNFWGSWCPPCVQEIPEFATWAAENPDVPILGIAVRSGEGAKLAKDAARLGVTWAVLESDEEVLADYHVDVFPTTVVVGADGTIKATARGAIDAEALAEMVAAAR
ncbi:MAG: TlpA family protein disulfide reductase [Myxococcota bacterium]